MKVKIKIKRLGLILICAVLLRSDGDTEKKHYPQLAQVNILKNKNRLPSASRRYAPPCTIASLPSSAPSMINELASSSLTVSGRQY